MKSSTIMILVLIVLAAMSVGGLIVGIFLLPRAKTEIVVPSPAVQTGATPVEPVIPSPPPSSAPNIVAMYEYGSGTLVMKSDGTGKISGGVFGPGSNFHWKDTGKQFELSNWDWSEVQEGKGWAEKLDGSIELHWRNQGDIHNARLFQVAI